MAEETPEIKGGRNPFSVLKDQLKSYGWAEEVAKKYDTNLNRVGAITEQEGIVPVFIDRLAIDSLEESWQSATRREIYGWLIGGQAESDGHPFVHISTFLGYRLNATNSRDFSLASTFEAHDFIERASSRPGEKRVIIGAGFTHPKHKSHRLTADDLLLLKKFETDNRGPWSSNRAHLVITPEDNNAIDLWQAKHIEGPLETRLIRNGYFVLEPKPKYRRPITTSFRH